MTGADVVAAARTHIGTRWEHQARLPGVAMDCAGLVIVVARQLGLVAPNFDVTGYAAAPDGTLLDWCGRYMERIDALELGAVVVLATQQEPQHVGIIGDYLHGGWSLIHSTNAVKPARVIEHRYMPAINMRQCGAFRLPGVH